MSKVYFIMGRPATGKSTTAKLLNDELNNSKKCFLIDADDLSKHKVMPKIGDFSLGARLTRAKHLVKLINWLSDQYEIIIVAAIGQPKEARLIWRKKIENSFFIYLKSEISSCEKRDFKGIYSLKENVIGKDIPFDEPNESDLIIENNNISANDVLQIILKKVNF